MVNLSRLLYHLSSFYNAVLQPQMQASGLPSSKFARRYYRNLYLISLPLATEMFQFTRFASHTYVFSVQYLLLGGFPHSEISGSMLICQLPEAYRRLSRLFISRATKINALRFVLDE